MHRGLKPLLAVAAITLAAGCGAPSDPQVTFYSHGNAVEVRPAQYCDPTGQECSKPPADPAGELRMTGREPLQISVPDEVASTPWQVAFVYRDLAGKEVESRVAVFPPNTRHAYTLHLPPDAKRIEHVEVQQYSAVLTQGSNGGVQFGIGGSWVLNIHQ